MGNGFGLLIFIKDITYTEPVPPVLPVAEPGALYIRVGDYYIPDLTLPEEIRPSRSSARHP